MHHGKGKRNQFQSFYTGDHQQISQHMMVKLPCIWPANMDTMKLWVISLLSLLHRQPLVSSAVYTACKSIRRGWFYATNWQILANYYPDFVFLEIFVNQLKILNVLEPIWPVCGGWVLTARSGLSNVKIAAPSGAYYHSLPQKQKNNF